ncbi:MAG: alpha-ketoacid dehydrogenase subunit beta [Chloroflexi bacterium]|nr:alpha-ketoacid dehydrogenase subunit beta [Chloroflexota bacterium]
MRELKYWQALSEGLTQAMEADESVFVMGVGVDDPKGIFGTTAGPYRKFGSKRVFDIPISENALTGMAIGASLSGMRPVMVHARNDFMLLTMDQIINNASKWLYVSGGAGSVPITIRSIIGRGWGQGAQHSQSLQAVLAHFPGIKVVMPATPYDAKGLLMASIRDDNPVIVLEHRQLYDDVGPVPEEPYEVPLGRAIVRRPGRDISIVAASLMVSEALKAADVLSAHDIDAEVIDLRTISPMDDELIFDSVRRTHRLIIADTAWKKGGIGSEIVARVVENVFDYLGSPARCIGSPHVPAPVCSTLERVFYPGAHEIVIAATELINGKSPPVLAQARHPLRPIDEDFGGPF